MRYYTYLHYSSFYQKHRLPFHIVTPVVTIIHCGPFEYVRISEVILQLNSLYEAILQLKLIVLRYSRVQPWQSIHDVMDVAQPVNQILSVYFTV